MFVWTSEYFKQWENGYIIVDAHSIEDARIKAIAKMIDYFYYNDMEVEYYLNYDKDDSNTINLIVESWNMFINDINQTPKIVECLFIPGSE